MKSDKNPMCPHCAIVDAVNAFRESPGAKDLVTFQRTSSPEDAYAYSDEQLVRMALLRGIATVVWELLSEETDGRIQADMTETWTDALVSAQLLSAGFRKAT